MTRTPHGVNQKERADDMPATLHITNKLYVTPLLDMQGAAFAGSYRNGLWWSLYGEYQDHKPLPDSYLVDNLKREVSIGTFDGQHNDSLYSLGFYFGMIHGGILVPRNGQLRRDVTTLVTFTHRDTRHGYSVGRRDHFYYSESRIVTDSGLIEELCQSAQDLMSYPDEPASWYYCIGCLLGSLSVSLFPATSQEWQAWEAEHCAWQAQLNRDTDPLDSVPVVEYTI